LDELTIGAVGLGLGNLPRVDEMAKIKEKFKGDNKYFFSLTRIIIHRLWF
jgi:hypothetical protein